MRLLVVPTFVLLLSTSVAAAAPPAGKPSDAPQGPVDERYPFRTDEANAHLPWYELKAGEFPPAGSAHYIGGELIQVDHVNRTAVLRPDRTNDQSRAFVDRPLPFKLLPYGSVYYLGAPATLKDVPLGTHLHGDFYWDEQRNKDPALVTAVTDRRIATFYAFDRCSRLEDDFSRSVRTGVFWRLEQVRLDSGKLAAIRIDRAGNPADDKPTEFDVQAITRVWKGRGFGTLDDLAVGQVVALNLTECTLKGPGRVNDVWLDEESRRTAVERQAERHRFETRRRGLPGLITAVDDEQRRVTVTLFDGFDPELRRALLIPYVTVAVADDRLRTYDQVNIVKSGPIIELKHEKPRPGSSGLVITFAPNDMLEGFRVGRHLRVFPSTWPINDLPREEELVR